MRTRLIAKQVEHFYQFMNLNVTEKNNGGNIYKIVNNWADISTALYKLNEHDFVGDSIEQIFKLGAAFQSSAATISILNSEFNNFVIKFNIVKAKCEAIIKFYTEDNEDTQDLYIKLPSGLKDLDELHQIVRDLDIAFNKCPVLNQNIGNINFKRVEEGSSWLVLTIGAVVAGSKVLSWIANYIKICNEIRMQNANITNIELDNILKYMEITEKERESYKKKILQKKEEDSREFCMEEFRKINFDNNNITKEDEARITHSMKVLAELLDRGVEMYPAYSTEDEIKKLFPKKEEIKELETAKKLLKNGD